MKPLFFYFFWLIALLPRTCLATELFPKLETDGHWRDQNDVTVNFDEFKDEWVFVTLAYTTCSGVCSLSVENLKSVEAGIRGVSKKFAILLIDIDPDGDSPATMKAFLKDHDVQDKLWHFIIGSSDATREFASRLGLYYEGKSSSNSQHRMHSFQTVLLSPQGEVVLKASNSSPKELIKGFIAKVEKSSP